MSDKQQSFSAPTVAIIADAGRATRFLPATKIGAKSLIPVGSKPTLLWILKEIKESGIKEVIIVANRYNAGFISKFIEFDKDLVEYLKDKQKTHLLDEYFDIIEALDIEVIIQPKKLGYGNAVPMLASQFLVGDRNFAYIFGDDLVFYKDKPALAQLIDAAKEVSKLGHDVTGVSIVEEVPLDVVHKYGVIRPTQNFGDGIYSFDLIVEKPKKKEAPSNLVSFGRYIFTPSIFGALLEYKDQVQKRDDLPEFYMQPAMTKLAQESTQLAVVTKETKWATTGDPVNMYKAWALWYKEYRDI